MAFQLEVARQQLSQRLSYWQGQLDEVLGKGVELEVDPVGLPGDEAHLERFTFTALGLVMDLRSANATNSALLTPASLSSAIAFRQELRIHWRRFVILAVPSWAGAGASGGHSSRPPAAPSSRSTGTWSTDVVDRRGRPPEDDSSHGHARW